MSFRPQPEPTPIRDEQERQAQELARRWHEEQEPEARIWRGPSMGM
ncbi:hypothetical protein [Salmonella enterica]|nr:hypothetical protein [Salmonella enterica]